MCRHVCLCVCMVCRHLKSENRFIDFEKFKCTLVITEVSVSLCIIHSLANYVFQVALPSGITRNYAKGKHWQTTTKAKGWGKQGSLFYLGNIFEQWLHICHSTPQRPLLRSCRLKMDLALVFTMSLCPLLPSPRYESSSLCIAAADLG